MKMFTNAQVIIAESFRYVELCDLDIIKSIIIEYNVKKNCVIKKTASTLKVLYLTQEPPTNL